MFERRIRPLALLSLLWVPVLAFGCAADEPLSVCQDAAAHLSACTGASTEGFTGSCGAGAALVAERTLDASCEELTSSTGKTDEANAAGLCVVLVLPLLIVHEIPEGDPCCIPYNCEAGLTCNSTTSPQTCQRPARAGNDCGATPDCDDGLNCVFGECAPPVVAGEPCEDWDCASGLACVAGVCGAPLAAGAACEDGDCAGELRCVSEICQAPVGPGLACAAGDCATGFTCLDGACQSRLCDAEDAPLCGIGAICWDGLCEPKHGFGEPCAGLGDCVFGLFCSEDGVCYDPFA